MSDAELEYLRERAARGDEDAAEQLVELAGEREDAYELRLLAENGGTDAMDQRVQLATETGDVDELRRLEAGGNPDAAEVLDDLYEEDPTDDGT
jgi:Fe-S cluster assembly iron-binding protein IscA